MGVAQGSDARAASQMLQSRGLQVLMLKPEERAGSQPSLKAIWLLIIGGFLSMFWWSMGPYQEPERLAQPELQQLLVKGQLRGEFRDGDYRVFLKFPEIPFQQEIQDWNGSGEFRVRLSFASYAPPGPCCVEVWEGAQIVYQDSEVNVVAK